jgi:hypothetical protein
MDEIRAHIDEREARTDEIGAHMDEKEARTDEKGCAHRWKDDEGGACGGARTPQWGRERLNGGAHGCRLGAHAWGRARMPTGCTYAWEGGVYT